MKGLGTLIRLRKSELDARRRALGALEQEAEELARAVLRLEGDLASESEAARCDAETAFGFGIYLAAVRSRRAEIERQADALAVRMETARDAVSDAFRELKRLEIARATAAQRTARAADRREQAALDEVALAGYRMREGGGSV